MTFVHKGIADAILSNGKRVDKIKAKGREQAVKFVVAECASQKVKLSEDDVIKLGVQVYHAI